VVETLHIEMACKLHYSLYIFNGRSRIYEKLVLLVMIPMAVTTKLPDSEEERP
jgi:hypothetical protein